MNPLPLSNQLITEVPHDIVEKNRNRARVVVILDASVDNIRFIRHGERVTVLVKTVLNGYIYTNVELWFKPSKIEYMVKNGVLTIDFTR